MVPEATQQMSRRCSPDWIGTDKQLTKKINSGRWRFRGVKLSTLSEYAGRLEIMAHLAILTAEQNSADPK
ncbi:hypothetical protein OG462_43150 [Streptomyces sp. NBC_01077]|uniref:hypothetical protein n=1 Tax=Streptomyces sp. NBC_01077 TaxID=2903746 RepID=UPI003864DFD5|nr:hypothetical protein OG462_01855 [Streptomyces sp. NBC_01077]WSV43593.1 hypothetical protein OG462_43150 [Streptomyces sp. NBC_01077]